MLTIENQFLFLIPDTNSEESDVTRELLSVHDGSNVAFIYNVSQPSAASCVVIKTSLISYSIGLIGFPLN